MAARRFYKRDRNGRFARVAGSAKRGAQRQIQAQRDYARRPEVRIQTGLAMTYSNLGAAVLLSGSGNRTQQSLAALHGAKAVTSAVRVGSTATRVGIQRARFSEDRRAQGLAKLDKFDRRLKNVDRTLNVGIGVGYGSIIGSAVVGPAIKVRAANMNAARAAASRNARPQIAARALSPTRPSRGGVYDITSMKGSRVRR